MGARIFELETRRLAPRGVVQEQFHRCVGQTARVVGDGDALFDAGQALGADVRGDEGQPLSQRFDHL